MYFFVFADYLCHIISDNQKKCCNFVSRNINIMSEKIAIVAIAYNRIDSLSRLLHSLSCAYYAGEEVPLYISIDKSDSDHVERFADDFHWPHGEKTVVRQKENMGLKARILSQGRLLNHYDAVIVLEDDLVVAPDFWNYTRQTVSKYKDNASVAGISLYAFSVNYHLREPFIPMHDGHDVYFMNCAMSWGQVWMRRAWKDFEAWLSAHPFFAPDAALPQSICKWGEKSWLRYHMRYCIEQDKYFVFPYVSYTTNYAEQGEHMRAVDTIFQVPLLSGHIDTLRLPEDVAAGVRYDGFFENKGLYHALGLKEDEVCLDLYRTNGNRTGKRYWLTTRRLPYAVERSFALGRRPIEQPVLDAQGGSGIFLYDTSRSAPRPKADEGAAYLHQHLTQNGALWLRSYGMCNVLKEIWQLAKWVVKLRMGRGK